MAELRVDDIDTPAPVVDLDRVERNLKRAADYFDEKKIALRPHIKTHKIVEFSRRQVELGAVGITCQKLGEAEVMVDGGITDILMTFPILGKSKLERLTALAKRAKMSAVTDSTEVADGIAEAARAAGVTIELLVECDTGTGRCGVQSAQEAVALAERIANTRGVGLIGAIELVANKETKAPFAKPGSVGPRLQDFAQEEGLVIRGIGEIMAFCPPLIITEAEVDDMFKRFDRAMTKLEAEMGVK